VLGNENPNTLQSVSNLAATLHRQGKHEEAEVLGRQALAGKKVLEDVSRLSVIIDNSTFTDQSKYDFLPAYRMGSQAVGKQRNSVHIRCTKSHIHISTQYHQIGSEGRHESATAAPSPIHKLHADADHTACDLHDGDDGKVDVDSKDDAEGWTPLSCAAQSGHEAVVKLLLETGKVDVDSKGSSGWTPLSWAARS
jgi:hypothetical protein